MTYSIIWSFAFQVDDRHVFTRKPMTVVSVWWALVPWLSRKSGMMFTIWPSRKKGFHVVFLRHIPWEAKWTPRFLKLQVEDIASSSSWETRSNSYSISPSIYSGMVVSRKKRGRVVTLNNLKRLKLFHIFSLILFVSIFLLFLYSSFHGFLTPPRSTTHFRRLHVELDHISTTSSLAKRDNA